MFQLSGFYYNSGILESLGSCALLALGSPLLKPNTK